MSEYTLYIGDYAYSSWSLRGWLLFEAFGIEYKSRQKILRTPEFSQMLTEVSPARLVPAIRTHQGVVWDTLAIAETLAEAHPECNMWPQDPVARAMARAIVAEMHSGFSALRQGCPMNVLLRYEGFSPSDAVLADCERIHELWAMARETYGASGPWLFGRYSIADAFYAPVVTRFSTYDLPLTEIGRTYSEVHYAHKPLRRWIAMAKAQNKPQARYVMDLPLRDGRPSSLSARVLSAPPPPGDAVNAVCPFSGRAIPPDCWAEIDGRAVGFCNPFCRDKAVADPLAWPQLEALLSRPSG